MRCLLLAYYFPPDGGPGAQRPISFARHLPAHGVSCTVLTRASPTRRGYFDPADEQALRAVQPHCRIVRAEGADLPMGELLPALVRAGDAAIRAERPDVVLVTMSPFELFGAAAELGRRFALPVVCDLRDPWALDGVMAHRSRWHWWRELAAMRRMLRSAAGVIANTPECRRLFLETEPALPPERVVTIPNGWDRDDFGGPAADVPVGDALQLVHGGSFLCSELYPERRGLRRLAGLLRYRPEPIQPSGRTPLHLLRAVRELRGRGEPAGTALRLVAVGQIDDALRRCVAESGAGDAVELRGYRPHAELVATLRRADALFVTLHGLPPGRRSRIVPGKVYEYLASGRPMLAALPPGDARDLVAASPRAFVVDPCDERAIAGRLVVLHERWRAGAFVRNEPPAGVERFERRALAGDLARFLSTVVGASK